MAFEDWDQVLYYGSSTAALNGSPPLTTNPLTIGSTYCRRLDATALGDAWPQAGAMLKSTYAGGAFYNVPNNRALRVQAYLRAESQNGGVENSLLIGAKLPSSIGGSAYTSRAPYGYALGIGSLGTNTTQDASVYLNGIRTSLPESGLGGISLNTWYGFRLEVFPLGTAADRVMCYRETSPGSGSWTKVYDITISASSSSYVPWGSNRRTGFCANSAFGSGRFMRGYVDLFDASVATAPTPIP